MFTIITPGKLSNKTFARRNEALDYIKANPVPLVFIDDTGYTTLHDEGKLDIAATDAFHALAEETI